MREQKRRGADWKTFTHEFEILGPCAGACEVSEDSTDSRVACGQSREVKSPAYALLDAQWSL